MNKIYTRISFHTFNLTIGNKVRFFALNNYNKSHYMSYFTKVISTLLLLLFALIIPKTGFAQPWTYNFGTAAGTTTHTSTTASTTFLPTPTNGTARAE